MRPRKWTVKELRSAVGKSKSVRQVIYKLGLVPAGGNYDHVQRYIKMYQLNTGHFTGRGWKSGLRGIGKPFIPLEKILVVNSDFQSYKLKSRLFKEGLKRRECEECGWAKLSIDGRIPVELDHINGNRKDNRLENLRVLCPNCHSLKSTHRGRNKKPRW